MVTNLDKKEQKNNRNDSDLDFQPIDLINDENNQPITSTEQVIELIDNEPANNNEDSINPLQQKIKDQNELINTLTEAKDTLSTANTDLKSQLLRIAADAQNASKQNEIDIINSKKISKKQVIKNLLPFLTTIVLSFAFSPENQETINFINQLKQALKKINTDFESNNIQFVIPVIGEQFDPNTMQALNSSESEEPKIVSIASVGCIVDGQVISPASVII